MSDTSSDWLQATAPPGSLRWYALTFAPAHVRAPLAALFAFEAELHEATRPGLDHGVAHTRLGWWRAEVDRLRGGHPEHPITRRLQALAPRADWALLHESLAAADLELAGLAYENAAELDAYLFRAGGALHWLAARLAAGEADAARVQAYCAATGRITRLAEAVRDLGRDAVHGRLYLPLDLLERHGLEPASLQQRDLPPAARAALAELAGRARAEFAALAPPAGHAAALVRGQHVLAALHLALLDEIARQGWDVGRRRIDLPPWRRPLCAWRAARHLARQEAAT